MLLALDVGNTNITIGTFDGAKLKARWRLRTIKEQTADEWGILMRNLFTLSSLDLAEVSGVIISSVVPAVDQPLEAMSERYFQRKPMFITYSTNLGIQVRYDNPREVGADRMVNGVAGFYKYGGPCVIIDLGTTINFDIVSVDGVFLGGVICPGIGMSIAGLFARTARLPMVDFREPEKLIGSNTVGSITSGLYYGFIGMIDGILERLVRELGDGTKCIATGGQGGMIVKGSRFANVYDEDLTLDGLRLIWERNERGPARGL
jgi:type III pantothenate kinase